MKQGNCNEASLETINTGESQMRVFLAMPYSQFCDETYTMSTVYKNFFKKLIAGIENHGHTVFLAAKRENWGANYDGDAFCTQVDYNEITSCDLVCMVPGWPFSGGVHVEAGWASAVKRPMNIFLQRDKFYSPMITGLHALTDVQYFTYDDFDDALVDVIVASICSRK